jgi:predicted acyltransferase
MQSKAERSAPITNVSAVPDRLASVDVLRGFDMFWIIGADAFVYALQRMTKTPVASFLATQLDHAEWAGFHFYDLIFPLFIFVVGVSLVFSLSKKRETGRTAPLIRIVRRSILLFLLGLFYSGGLTASWPDIRLMGVLNRIALAYFFSAILFTYLKPRILAAVSMGLLAGYWALLTFVPIRDIQLTKDALSRRAESENNFETAQLLKSSANFSTFKDSPAWNETERMFYSVDQRVKGKFDKGYNLADHLDFQYLPGRKYDVFFDPEGLLSTLSSIVTCLIGVFAGLLLKSRSHSDQRKIAYLIAFGVLASALGWIWHSQIPVIKKIWTPSFVLVAGGYSSILLGCFYWIVDVRKKRKWCQPFVWIGMNSIAIYLAGNIFGFRRLAARILGGDVGAFLNARIAQGFGDLMISVLGLALALWLVYFLYKRKIFIRV